MVSSRTFSITLLLVAFFVILTLLLAEGCKKKSDPTGPSASIQPDSLYVVLGYNDLGMHCMNEDFSEFMILPPYNTLHAQVIDKTTSKIVTSGVIVQYSIPGNTTSSNKTNFWQYVQPLLGVSLATDVGLSGHGLTGVMTPTGNGDWSVTGIPLTPKTDAGTINIFQLATVTLKDASGTNVLAHTQPVVPVSWELRCDLCHHGGTDAPKSVLDAHDRRHGTHLYDTATGGPVNGKPVLCGGCHAQPELGLAGQPGVENLSYAMHNAHTPRMMDVMSSVPGGIVCYSCHPGVQTQCLRDLHAGAGMTCYSCHGNGTTDGQVAMAAMADPSRSPWATEPKCSDCHHISGHEYEQAGTLFRNSVGHGGVFCEACHNSTHAITPTLDNADNVQSLDLQGEAGSISQCSVCHLNQPSGEFQHRAPQVAVK